MSDFFAWIAGIAFAIVPSWGVAPEPVYHGYIEADYVYVGPASAGRIAEMQVAEGEWVEKGALLFALEANSQAAELRASVAREAVAEANWRNMETGSRVAEVAVIRASLTKAQADQALAVITLSRSEKLMLQGFASEAKADADRAKLESADAQVDQLQAQLVVAELPARDAQLVAAKAAFSAAKADVDRAEVHFADRSIVAPVGGSVERVYFRAGEVASTGTPVVALLPPGELTARFYVPEPVRAQFRLGQKLFLTCDGCRPDLTAVISFMASDPQHTPPIIYSRDERSRLVFMAEARLEGETGLLPGQPVSLTLIP